MVQSFRPVPERPESGLVPVASNIWTIEAKESLCFRPPAQPRYPYTHRAVVIRLDDGSLFVISPIQLNLDLRADIDRLGTVKYLVSPNNLHHLHLGDWSQVYPDAKLYASPRLAPKRKDLTFYTTLSTDKPEPEWDGQIDQCIFGSGNGWFDEIVFFHRESRTIVFTDLIMDFDPSTFSSISRVTTRWNQMYQHTPRGVQLVHMFDRISLHDSLKIIRAWEPDRAIVAHSPWLCVEGKERVGDFFNKAFDWLTPKPAIIETVMGIGRLSTLLFLILPIHAFIVLTADILYPKLRKPSQGQ
ncbi:DUF4336 domain-containing protein [Oscillatoriales cyanobacterium LEGE 11467]|uniref:DUF4336 domain-containing protein n=1 Tax=Zarconia navalis LEGE 11467 TaxID=1828826 RepID=A0A928W2A5_9CYAN|nr:DUF4336 domain-containing protein [Zarconia navalis]MBE9042691.1 DUF4336 domain-containing protein [Zarconia navalis LEGE 11467]